MKNGFTLIEVFVVIAIISILAAIIVPAIFGGVSDTMKTPINGWSELSHNGHEYLRYNYRYDTSGIIHNPDCRCSREKGEIDYGESVFE